MIYAAVSSLNLEWVFLIEHAGNRAHLCNEAHQEVERSHRHQQHLEVQVSKVVQLEQSGKHGSGLQRQPQHHGEVEQQHKEEDLCRRNTSLRPSRPIRKLRLEPIKWSFAGISLRTDWTQSLHFHGGTHQDDVSSSIMTCHFPWRFLSCSPVNAERAPAPTSKIICSKS